MNKPTDQLVRDAIVAAEKQGMTRYAIAKAAGLPQSQVHRIAEGHIIPKLTTADRLLAALGLKIRIDKC